MPGRHVWGGTVAALRAAASTIALRCAASCVSHPHGALAPLRLRGWPPAAARLAVVEAAAEEEQPPSPLPDDPFNMETRLESSTVEELEVGRWMCLEESVGWVGG